jgi:hypothetical protein
LATIAEATIKDAQNVAINARRGLRRAKEGASGKATSLVAELERTIGGSSGMTGDSPPR